MASHLFSISAAHRITGKSRTTITKHLDEGKLSFSTDDNGNRLIEASELMRVYGDDCNFAAEEGGNSAPAKVTPASGQGDALLAKEQEERQRERTQLEAQIEHLKEALESAQEGYNRVTLLLENKSKVPDGVQQQLKVLEQRLSLSEQQAEEQLLLMKRKARAAIQRYKVMLEEERKKSLWDRLLNRG